MTVYQSIKADRRIALLIDADNIQAVHVGQSLEKLARLGSVPVRRAYGNWEQRKDIAATLQQHGIRAFHQPALTDHKNGSDIALAVDAIDLLHTRSIDAFAILSSDADFTPLMLRLREAGRDVYGFGETKAAKALQAACTEFFQLDDEVDALRRRLCDIIATCKATDGKVPLSSIGGALKNAGLQPQGTLNAFLRSHDLEVTECNRYCIASQDRIKVPL